MLDRKLVMAGKICPYCGNPSKHIDSKEIYGRSYGMIYACTPCNAWVGCHKRDQSVALGRLANQRLRDAKKSAHESFDPIWQDQMQQGMEKNIARSGAYEQLSLFMAVPQDECHIGMFNVQQCLDVHLFSTYYQAGMKWEDFKRHIEYAKV